MDSRVCLVIKAPLESLVNQVIWVFLENLVPWVRLDHGENVEFQGKEENLVQMVFRVLKEFLERLVPMGQRAAPDLLELSGMLVLLAFRECLERGVSLDLLGLKVTGEQSERKDLKEHLEMTGQEELQAPLAHWDLLDPAVRRENLDPKGPMDPQDPEEAQEREATPAQLALSVSLDHLVLMVNLESKESLESKARKEMLGLQDLRVWPVHTDPLDRLVLPD